MSDLPTRQEIISDAVAASLPDDEYQHNYMASDPDYDSRVQYLLEENHRLQREVIRLIKHVEHKDTDLSDARSHTLDVMRAWRELADLLTDAQRKKVGLPPKKQAQPSKS